MAAAVPAATVTTSVSRELASRSAAVISGGTASPAAGIATPIRATVPRAPAITRLAASRMLLAVWPPGGTSPLDTTCPSPSTTASRAVRSERSTPRVRSLMRGLPIRVRVQLASVKGQKVGGEEVRVQPLQERRQPTLVGRADHQHAAALRRWKLLIVEIIAVEGYQRAAQLPGQPEVFDVAGAPQIGLIHHEQHVPLQRLAHERDNARRDVGVRINARPIGDGLRNR